MDDVGRTAANEMLLTVGTLPLRLLIPGVREESSERISFWWHVTPAAIALAGHLAEKGNLSGIQVIELGCGLGLPGITAAMLGANVLFTDCVPEALEFAESNARLNGISAGVADFRILDWEDTRNLPLFDIVLGSEILYDYFYHNPLLKLLDRVLKADGVIYLADRKRLVVSRIIGRLRDAGFMASERTVTVELDSFPSQEIQIFQATRV